MSDDHRSQQAAPDEGAASPRLEEGRPLPDFAVTIEHDVPLGTVGQHLALALQDVYDIAVNSMDFGSGFLSTEEIQNLRILGKAIGAEPLHYKCDRRPEGVVQAGTVRALREPPGTVIPAVPCTCGALAL